ncbi:MAG: hypothetical protein A2Z20_01820 [Bdellovibrionales bacterium RBG_16_40_8]|nr:MAG: hypothetical protein A2Z20_01820 [Bdellovibrionales bacterium RBG_16_40_8]
MKFLRDFFFVLYCLIFLFGCSNTANNKLQASHRVTDSFIVVKSQAHNNLYVLRDADLKPSENRYKIRINKAALDKEFIWHAELLAQLGVPKFSGLKSRIVLFRQYENSIFMLESPEGHYVTKDFSQTIVLTQFPITNEDTQSIEFDFNKGMSEIFTAAEWRASDLGGENYPGITDFTSTPVRHSFLEKVEFTEQNELVIFQHAELTIANSDFRRQNTPISVRHYISPYKPNTEYKPIITANFDRMGFFEIAPRLSEGSVTKIFATRFDPAQNKSIVYAISANTPAEFKDAIRDGVLYWNRAFGYEKITVIDAPAGIAAPDSGYNIIQWVPWDAAGFAYADAQTDPRTGEIRHAQIFLTSAFAFIGKMRARQLIKQIDSFKKPEAYLTIAGIPHSTLCDFDGSAPLHNLLSKLVATDISDEKILEISRDYVREVVAHEVGHTLGLRHNFAGSFGANFDIFELKDIFSAYLKKLELRENIQFTSSVMEYLDFQGSVMTGRLITKPETKSFTYDKKAIDVLYNGAELNSKETPLFCTDSHSGKYIGCTAFDQGHSPLANVIYNEKNLIETMPQDLIEKIIAAKTPPFELPSRKIEEIILHPDLAANAILSPRKLVIQLIADEAKDLRIHRLFAKIDSLNKDVVTKKTVEATAAEISRLGGLDVFLAAPSPSLYLNWSDEFNALIESPIYREGLGYNGERYRFTDDEISQAKDLAAVYFAEVQKALAMADISSLTIQIGALTDSPISDELANIIAARMNEYIMSETGEILHERVVISEIKSIVLNLPFYKYDKDVRLAAAKMLVGRDSLAPDWGLVQHNTMKNLFINKIKSLLMNNEINTIRADKNSRSVAKWVIENKAIIATLTARD